MTIADTAENPAAARNSFVAQIADQSFQFREVAFDDRKVTGAQIAEAAGAYPATDYVVLHHLPNHEIETVRLTELIDLKATPRLFVIKGDSTDRFFVDGLSLEWPRKSLTGAAIKQLAGKDEDLELLLERVDQPDKVIDDDDEVRIGAPGVEKFHTRPAQVKVTIIVNTRSKPWMKKRISFAEVVALAYRTSTK